MRLPTRLLRGVVLALLVSPGVGAQTGESISLSEEARKNLGIELGRVERRDIHDLLTVRGMLREQLDRVAWVGPPTKGQVAAVHVKVADRVRRGDVLLSLHCPELERLRSELVEGLERVRLLDGEVERMRTLVDRRILARRDLLRVESEAALAGARVAATRRGIYLLGMSKEELGELLEDPDRPAFLPLHAPIGGSVTRREAFRGEPVEPDRRLFKIMDTSVLWAEADVFERDVPKIHVGQTVSLVLRPFEDWRSEGVIKAISADLDPQKRTAHLWIEVVNSSGKLMPQMAVDMSVLLDSSKETLAVPKGAVLEEQGERFVFVTNGDAFLRQRVVTGRQDHLFWEILEGVYEGDEVVTRGNHELKLATSAQGPAVGADGHAHQH